jgi:predicted transporter
MALFPILSWLNTHNLRLSIEGYALIAGEILLSFLLIWIGIKRYRNWQLEKE